jgi:hypothetical protein
MPSIAGSACDEVVTCAKFRELLEAREDRGAADVVDTMIKALNNPAFVEP